MKKSIHPAYDYVLFKDVSTDYCILTKSTKKSDQKILWEDGKEYPLIHVEISSASHPFFTGREKLVDTAGRIERFNRKYARKS
jgi:large subunit ribosomal protein L31